MRNPATLTLRGSAATDIVRSRPVWHPQPVKGGFHMLLTNHQIAQRLRQQATALARGGDNLYRVRAFRQAAMTVLALPVELSALVAVKGRGALEHLPGVGKSLAETIVGYLNAT
jgi:Holliday junction DNA helicase RuvA